MSGDPAAVARWLSRVDDLGLYPALARRAQRVASDPGCSVQDMAVLVAGEPAVALRVVRLANSSFFGLRRPAHDLRGALVGLGLREAGALVVAVAIGARLATDDVARSLWRHGLRTGGLARLLVTESGSGAGAEALLAGIVHDIGQQVFLHERRAEYLPALISGAEGARFLATERARFGLDHATLAGACLASWGAGDALVEAVTHHHGAAPSGGRVAAALRLADRIDRALISGWRRANVAAAAARTGDALGLGLDAAVLLAVMGRVGRRRPLSPG